MWKNEDYISYVEDRKWHDVRYAIDAEKIQNDLWWLPKIKFENWIVTTIKYYLSKQRWSE